MKTNLISALVLSLVCLLTGCVATAVTVAYNPIPPGLVILQPGPGNVLIETQPVDAQ